jgi:RNA polymerase sigma factor for flagellar operon FliA
MKTVVPMQAPDESRDCRVEAHIHLVDSIARKLRSYGRGSGVELDDLVAYGRIGLLDAATRFDTTLGVPFEAFARRRIRGAIIDGIRRDGWFGRRGYRHAIAGLRGIVERAANDPGSPVVLPAGLVILHAEQGAEAGGEDMPAQIGERGDSGDGARWNGRRTVQMPVESDDAFDALLQTLAATFSLLPARQRRVLELCYYHDKKLSQAAGEMDLQCSSASRLRKRALNTIRAAIESCAASRDRPLRLQENDRSPAGRHQGEVAERSPRVSGGGKGRSTPHVVED